MDGVRALVALLVAACAASPPAHAPPAPPRAAALVLLEAALDLDGRPLGASEARATVAISFASWCVHCHRELDLLAGMRAGYPGARFVGVNYRGHEEYAGRGGDAAVRAYVAGHAPWLRVVPVGDAAFAALGRPPKVPTLFVYDRGGALVATYDRRTRALPSAGELGALLRGLGADQPGGSGAARPR